MFKILPKIFILLICLWILNLWFAGNLNLYIHPRYTIFTIATASLVTILCIVNLLFEIGKWFRKEKQERHPDHTPTENIYVSFLACAVVAVCIYLPANTLSSNFAAAKTMVTPLSENSGNDDLDTSCPTEKPQSFSAWFSAFQTYKPSCFDGQQVEMSGFIYHDASSTLPSNYSNFGKLVMACCVVDSRPYVIPTENKNLANLPDDTVIKIRGHLRLTKLSGRDEIILQPDEVTQGESGVNPYDYIMN